MDIVDKVIALMEKGTITSAESDEISNFIICFDLNDKVRSSFVVKVVGGKQIDKKYLNIYVQSDDVDETWIYNKVHLYSNLEKIFARATNNLREIENEKNIVLFNKYFGDASTDEEVKKTSAEWVEETGDNIIDPDGWDRKHFLFSFYEEKITFAEFKERLLINNLNSKQMKKTNIEWTDHSWNIARGCSKVDGDCKNCYMYRDASQYGYPAREVVRTKTVFTKPLKIKEASKFFASSLTDVFHPSIDSYRDEFWDIIRRCPHHTFQVLTKRPERILDCLPNDWGAGYPNVWMGTSIGHQAAMGRYFELLKVPARVRFVSFEPLWERVDFSLEAKYLDKLDWAIIGGESGNESGTHRYRPCKIEWIESLISEFGFGTSVFVKQMGTHLAKELGCADRHGRDVEEFPEHIQLREFPELPKL